MDSVHSDTYKVLGGLNRTDYVPENEVEGGDDDGDETGENNPDNDDEDQENGSLASLVFADSIIVVDSFNEHTR